MIKEKNIKLNWSKSRDLLTRSVSIPIFVKQNKDQISKHAEDINKILRLI